MDDAHGSDPGPAGTETASSSVEDGIPSAEENVPSTEPAASDAEAIAEEPEPLALETALTWLAKVKPASVLALLRDPDFAVVSMTAFAGFRVNAGGYANPLVRRRLAQEAVRDEKFADKLHALAEAALPVAPPTAPAASSPKKPDREQNAARQEALRAERDQRRRERDAARESLAASEAALTEAERRMRDAESERDDARRELQRHLQRINRLERQTTRLQAEQVGLLRALREQERLHGAAPAAEHDTPASHRHGATPHEESIAAPHSQSPDSGPRPKIRMPDDTPWRAAVAHLLDKGRSEQALSLAEDVLRTHLDNTEALDIAARALERRDDGRAAAPYLRRLQAALLSHGNAEYAAEALLRLLLAVPPAEADREIRAFLATLRPEEAREIERAKSVMARLRGLAPEKHQETSALIAQYAAPSLAEALMPPPGLLGPDDPLPLDLVPPLSAAQLLQAVDSGRVGVVERFRAAISAAPQAMARIRQTIERAAHDDPSRLIPLFQHKLRGPIVVDGSNVAWHNQDLLAAGRPRLRPIRELRRTLRERGYFPVLIFGDAPLPFTIDEPEALREMAARGELILADSGIDADEVLLREAKHHRAPVVTNDQMTDWDPLNEVPKLRYTFSLHGDVYLLHET